jgi:hypothetical protein
MLDRLFSQIFTPYRFASRIYVMVMKNDPCCAYLMRFNAENRRHRQARHPGQDHPFRAGPPRHRRLPHEGREKLHREGGGVPLLPAQVQRTAWAGEHGEDEVEAFGDWCMSSDNLTLPRIEPGGKTNIITSTARHPDRPPASLSARS